MTDPGSQVRSRLTAAAVLALVALFIQTLIPPGFMLAASSGGAPAMVICTGHGPLALTEPGDHQLPPQKQKASGACAFAGHGAAPILPAPPAPIAIQWAAAAPAAAKTRPSVFIGRGLAAPPPARAPPSFLA
ncbi:MAG TPA: DUF2946 family protein [Caulobacteraceae bacterium]